MNVKYRSRHAIALLITLLGMMNIGFAAEHSPVLKKAVATYEKAATASKDDLIEGFDRAAKSVSKRKIDALAAC